MNKQTWEKEMTLRELIELRPEELIKKLRTVHAQLRPGDSLWERAATNVRTGQPATFGFTDAERDYYVATVLLEYA
jgi:hypothetical protein